MPPKKVQVKLPKPTTGRTTRAASKANVAMDIDEEDEEEDQASQNTTKVSNVSSISSKAGPGPRRGRVGGRRPLEETRSLNTTQMSNASTVASTIGRIALDAGTKDGIWTYVLKMLEDSQQNNALERKRAYKLFQKEFYKEKSPRLANEYQKYFVSKIWKASLLAFKAQPSPPVENTLKFLHLMFTTSGTAEDKAEAGYPLETNPMFYYVLKLFLQCHMEERQLVRLRVIQIAFAILEKHSNHPLITGNQTLRKDLTNAFCVRLRDKYNPVRALAASCLQFFSHQNKEMIKDLKYFSRFDPSGEVRVASVAALKGIEDMKSRFFYDHIFDSDTKVRVEALSHLSNIEMKSLHPEQRMKTLYWGLQQEGKALKVVKEKLIPSWLGQCGQNPIVFLHELELATKPGVAYLFLNTIYPDDFIATFESIDRGFLDQESKLIPVQNITLDAVLFWVWMLKKFGGSRDFDEKIYPKKEDMVPYMRRIIEAIHEEHAQAIEEDRDEDCTLLMSLNYVISITTSLGFEEATRRQFEEVLRDILLDPILDEGILVKTAVSTLKKIVEKHLFQEKMEFIFQHVFEPSDPTIVEKTPQVSPFGASVRSGRSNRSGASGGEERMDQTLTEGNGEDDNVQQQVRPAPPTEMEIIAWKDKVCELGLQRIRLGEEKAKALDQQDYLAAHELQTQIDAVLVEEQRIRNFIATPQSSFDEGYQPRSLPLPLSNKIGGSHPQPGMRRSVMDETSKMEMEVDFDPVDPAVNVRDETPQRQTSTAGRSGLARASRVIEEDDFAPLSQAANAGNQVGISEQNLLKGLIMLSRFLNLHRKMIPVIRQFYENHLFNCLMNEDPRIRSHTLELLCMIALTDKDEKRKIMAFMLRALAADIDCDVKSIAFKVVVDLLLQYDIKGFRCPEEADLGVGELPETYTNPDATDSELEEMFLLLLQTYGTEVGMQSPRMVGIRADGLMKLLMMGRITKPSIVSAMLEMWIDKQYVGSSIPYNVGLWLPVFCKTKWSNAILVAQALLASVKRIVSHQGDKEHSLNDADFTKLIEFVCPYLSPGYLNVKVEDRELLNIHAELGRMILEDIHRNSKRSGNSQLMKLFTKLQILSVEEARPLSDTLGIILLKISNYTQTATVVGLKTAIKLAAKKLKKLFGELNDIEEMIHIENSDNEADPNPFSDDDTSPNLLSSEASDKEDKDTTVVSVIQRSQANSQVVQEKVEDPDSDNSSD